MKGYQNYTQLHYITVIVLASVFMSDPSEICDRCVTSLNALQGPHHTKPIAKTLVS